MDNQEVREIPANVADALSKLKGPEAQTFFQWAADEIGLGENEQDSSEFLRGGRAHHLFLCRLLEVEIKIK